MHEGDGAALDAEGDDCLLGMHHDMHQTVEGREGEGAVFPEARDEVARNR